MDSVDAVDDCWAPSKNCAQHFHSDRSEDDGSKSTCVRHQVQPSYPSPSRVGRAGSGCRHPCNAPQITGGITNVIFKARNEATGEGALVRVYGKDTDLLLDRRCA